MLPLFGAKVCRYHLRESPGDPRYALQLGGHPSKQPLDSCVERGKNLYFLKSFSLTSPDGNLHVYNSSAGSVTAATDANELVLESATNVGMSFLTANDSIARIKFGDPDATNAGIISYVHSDNSMRFTTNTGERLRITSSGALGTNSTVRSANGGLDLCAQGATNLGTLTLGASGGQNGQNRNANTENQFRIMTPTYANPSNMFTVMYGASGSSLHEINYGGGTGWAYAANLHRFFTASDQTTGTGTERMRISKEGYITKPAHPSFHARLINHTNAASNPLVYDDVLVNVGSHYKSSGSDAGKFVVPVAGTYFFFWEAIKNGSSGVTRLYLMKNGARLYNSMHLRLQEEGNYANGCMNVIMTLAVNDKIYIDLSVGGVHASEYTHFGGYLIG